MAIADKTDVIEVAAAAMQPIVDSGIIVKQGWYDDNINDTHITLWLLNESDIENADDDADTYMATLQVNIWATTDNIDLKKRVKNLLKKAGLQFIESNDNYENDAKIFVKQMRFIYCVEI